MRAPGFWYRSPGLLSAALSPISLIWRLATALRKTLTRPAELGIPVICVGNLTAGGAGKTPMVARLARHFTERGIAAHIVSRGYGGTQRGPHRVDPKADSADEVGDEPLLLAATFMDACPVWIARDRVAASRAAAKAGAQVIILDDGFQNPKLRKDLSILMVDAGQGFGNRHVIPAGPLREPVSPGLARADLTVLIGADHARKTAQARWPALGGALAARLEPPETGLDLSGQPVVAFAGIGRPEKFFDTLRDLGADLIQAEPFPDHHRYSHQILDRLLARARASGAMLVTTEKDAVRLPSKYRLETMVIPVNLVLEDDAAFEAVLDRLPVSKPA